MPIKEESFRIGCGRYLQKTNVLNECGKECLRFGKSPLIVGGKTALQNTRDILENSISSKCTLYEIIEYQGTCNEESATNLANYATEKGFDVVIGVGGGVIMDFAKLISYFSKLPLINIPTSSATCAAYTPMSVCYTPDGRTVGTRHYDYEVSSVLVDTNILSSQPPRLLIAGIFDALAKFVEIKQRFNESDTNYPLGLDWAYVLSEKSFNYLHSNLLECISDMSKNRCTPTVERVIFTSIATTGVISGIARGSNQCALAHKFYETTRTLFPKSSNPYIHGEIVGIGLLLQNHFNGEEQNNQFLLEIMKKNNMPYKITDIGITPSKEVFNDFYTIICNSSAIDKENPTECSKFKDSLHYLWEI